MCRYRLHFFKESKNEVEERKRRSKTEPIIPKKQVLMHVPLIIFSPFDCIKNDVLVFVFQVTGVSPF